MKKHTLTAMVLAGTIAFATTSGNAATEPFLTVVNSGDNLVLLADPKTGEIVNDGFIDLNPLDAGTPLHAIQVGEEIWVSDQLRDRIDRFDLFGNHLSTIGGQVPGGGLDNIRGMAVIGDEVWVTNAGDDNDAPGQAVVRIDLDGNIVGDFPVDGSAWFISQFNDEVLISFSGGDSRIDRYDLDGNFIDNFNTPGEINFIQQTHVKADGNVYASSFSGPQSGVYEYEPDGTNLGVIEGTQPFGPRGSWELGNGNLLWTNGAGVWSTDPSTGETDQFAEGMFRFISSVELPVELTVFFDIRPGSCPNPLNRKSQGVVPTAILGTEDLDVTDIDPASLMLSRADGVGGYVTPLDGPPGPGITIEDVGTPFEGEPCDCHDAGGDGIDDLALKFSTQAIVNELELDEFFPGEYVELVIEGTLADGTPFSGTDCIRIVGGSAQHVLFLLSNWGPCKDTSPGGCPADLNGDGQVGVADLLIMISNM